VSFVDLAIAAVLVIVVFQVGLWVLRTISSEPPPPPPAGELRKINAKYRCSVCGMEMRVMLAPEEDPDPPRHCMEEMELLPARE
jgi:hypothetical protein